MMHELVTCTVSSEFLCDQSNISSSLSTAHFLPEELQFLSWNDLHALSTRDEPIPYLERFKIVPFRQVNTQRTTPVDAASMSICSYLCDFADDCVS